MGMYPAKTYTEALQTLSKALSACRVTGNLIKSSDKRSAYISSLPAAERLLYDICEQNNSMMFDIAKAFEDIADTVKEFTFRTVYKNFISLDNYPTLTHWILTKPTETTLKFEVNLPVLIGPVERYVPVNTVIEVFDAEDADNNGLFKVVATDLVNFTVERYGTGATPVANAEDTTLKFYVLGLHYEES